MKVFLSYSHKDTRWKDELMEEIDHLKRLIDIFIWHDGLIKHGSKWQREINSNLSKADAAILLISNAFLGSEFCLDIEVAKILKKYREKKLKIYPIIVHTSDFQPYEWLRELELRPKNPKGHLTPLASLKPKERREFYTEFSKELREYCKTQKEVRKRHAGSSVPKYSRSKDDPRKQTNGKQLFDDDHRKKYAKSLASEYQKSKASTLKQLVKSYMGLYQKGHSDYALDLLYVFNQALSENGIKITDSLYHEILDLLEAGLPREPVHLKDLSKLTAEALFSNPGYASLLHGIRLTETDYNVAIDHFRKASKRHGNLRSCAQISYALGQCHRKIGHLDEAIGMLDLALKQIKSWKSDHCECGPKCLKDGLLVEIHRGLGAAYRKKEMWEEAGKHFQEGEKYLTDQIPESIKADFLFSYGYYIFEHAYKFFMLREASLKPIDEKEYQKSLRKSKKKFEQSLVYRAHWPAPLTRLTIVRQLLGNTNIFDYLTARESALRERSVESRLNAVICGFAVLVDDLGKFASVTPVRELNSQKLYKELEQEFQEVFISKGPRVCHAFDNAAILNFRDLRADNWLYLTNALLQESAEWDYDSLNEQRKVIKNFRRSHGIK